MLAYEKSEIEVPLISRVTGYESSQHWLKRYESLQDLACSGTFPLSPEKMENELLIISVDDASMRVRDLASEMLQSYTQHNNFHNTSPFRTKLQKEETAYLRQERKRIKVASFHYDPTLPSSQRYETLTRVAQFYREGSADETTLLSDLLHILEKEDSKEIRELVRSMLTSYQFHKDFSFINEE